jgi:hypothetical protein
VTTRKFDRLAVTRAALWADDLDGGLEGRTADAAACRRDQVGELSLTEQRSSFGPGRHAAGLGCAASENSSPGSRTRSYSANSTIVADPLQASRDQGVPKDQLASTRHHRSPRAQTSPRISRFSLSIAIVVAGHSHARTRSGAAHAAAAL